MARKGNGNRPQKNQTDYHRFRDRLRVACAILKPSTLLLGFIGEKKGRNEEKGEGFPYPNNRNIAGCSQPLRDLWVRVQRAWLLILNEWLDIRAFTSWCFLQFSLQIFAYKNRCWIKHFFFGLRVQC